MLDHALSNDYHNYFNYYFRLYFKNLYYVLLQWRFDLEIHIFHDVD